MHDAVRDWVAHTIDRFGLFGDVLDLGGRDVNGTIRDLFTDSTYTVVDREPHPTVDIVGDAATVDIGRRFDVVVSTEVLEHTPDGAAIVANACRHLRHGGMFIATMAGVGRRPHGMSGAPEPAAGEWYRNVTHDDLTGWLGDAGFGMWQLDTLGADLRCWAKR